MGPSSGISGGTPAPQTSPFPPAVLVALDPPVNVGPRDETGTTSSDQPDYSCAGTTTPMGTGEIGNVQFPSDNGVCPNPVGVTQPKEGNHPEIEALLRKPSGELPTVTAPAAIPKEETAPANPATPETTSTKLEGRDPDLIYAGEKIKLPDGSTYTVKDGDTLSGIAKAHGASLASLIKLNGFNEQLLDEYKNGKLFKAHHVGDPMPTTPGGATAVPGTPQVPPASLTTATPDPANSNPSSNTGVVNSDQAISAGTSPKELLKNIDRITNEKDRETLKNLLEILAKHDDDPSAPLLTADQNLQWLDLGKRYGENFGLADAS